MKNVSKILLAAAAASGVAAYLVNKFGSSKMGEPSFEDTLDLYKTDIEGMSFDEFGGFMRSVNEREIPSNLSESERTEYFKAVSVLSDNIQKAVSRFRKSGELSDAEADIIRQVFGAVDSSLNYAKRQKLMD